MKKLLAEFRAFAVKGNVIDLAIGVIIGQAFGKIVSSLVNDIVMPAFGLMAGLAGKVDFSTLSFYKIYYGRFIQSIVDFLIISVSIFFAVKGINELKKRLERQIDAVDNTPPPTKTELLLEEIRDLLKKEKMK